MPSSDHQVCQNKSRDQHTVLQYFSTNLTRVFTLATSISYSLLTACFILGLLALISAINTSVLLSSIFFIAASVVSGCFMIAYWSNLFFLGADLLGYFGFLFFLNVFGRLNTTEVRTFFLSVVRVPFSTAFLAFKAADFALVVDAKQHYIFIS